MSALMIVLAAAAALTVLAAVAYWVYGTFLHKPMTPAVTVIRKIAPQPWNGKEDSRGIR